jgi:adenylate cyclase
MPMEKFVLGKSMNLESLFDKPSIMDLSFFNFENAITAAYFADENFEIQRVNPNFLKFFPLLKNVTGVYFPDVLAQLGMPEEQVQSFLQEMAEKGTVLVPEIRIDIDGEERIYSLLSARTHHEGFSYLNGIQGQFFDRTIEWKLKKEREALLDQKLLDREIIEEKTQRLEHLATRLAQYLSPQIYESIFHEESGISSPHSRKNLTVFFSDIEQFVDLSDSLEPEMLATIINSYLSEMASIALECGGTIDKFIGDAMLIFFGDPQSQGPVNDALSCCEMAIRMQARVQELHRHWQNLGAVQGLRVRMGITTGYCTVGNFGSEQRLDYTVLGSPVNLAARLQGIAPSNTIYIDEATYNHVEPAIECLPVEKVTPKGFARPIQVHKLGDFVSQEHRDRRQQLTRIGKRVEVRVTDSSDVSAAIMELQEIQSELEARLL